MQPCSTLLHPPPASTSLLLLCSRRPSFLLFPRLHFTSFSSVHVFPPPSRPRRAGATTPPSSPAQRGREPDHWHCPESGHRESALPSQHISAATAYSVASASMLEGTAGRASELKSVLHPICLDAHPHWLRSADCAPHAGSKARSKLLAIPTAASMSSKPSRPCCARPRPPAPRHSSSTPMPAPRRRRRRSRR